MIDRTLFQMRKDGNAVRTTAEGAAEYFDKPWTLDDLSILENLTRSQAGKWIKYMLQYEMILDLGPVKNPAGRGRPIRVYIKNPEYTKAIYFRKFNQFVQETYAQKKQV